MDEASCFESPDAGHTINAHKERFIKGMIQDQKRADKAVVESGGTGRSSAWFPIPLPPGAPCVVWRKEPDSSELWLPPWSKEALSRMVLNIK